MREFVLNFAERRRLSLSRLAVRLGYKSRTSLVRVMDQSVRASSVRDFESRLLQHFELSEAERADLERAVEIKLYGEQSYLTDQGLWALLRQDEPEDTSGQIRVVDAVTGRPYAWQERLSQAENIRATILNAEDAPVMGWVRQTLSIPGTRVRQYVRGGLNLTEILAMLRTVSSALTCEGYDIYVRNPEVSAHVPRRGSLLIIECTIGGEPFEYLVCFHSHREAALLERRSNGVFQTLIAPDLDSFCPLKDNGKRQGQAEADYIAYLSHCTKQEYGREVLSIKSVPRYDTIPPSVFGDSLLDVLPAEVRRAGVELQHTRVENLRTCKREIYTVHRLSAMRSLAETGRMPDHFWAMRAFTRAEVAVWFRSLLDNHRVNPHFHVLFLRDEDAVSSTEYTWVGGLGLIIMPQASSYDFGGNHAETLIYHEELMNAYHDFFMDQVIPRACLDENESLALLEALAEECERSADMG